MKRPDLSSIKSELGSLKDNVGSVKKGLDPGFTKIRASTVEKSHEMSVLRKSVLVVLVSSVLLFVICVLIGDLWSLEDYLNNIFCNTISLVVVVVCLDTIVSSNKESRRRREEARKIIRYSRLISPDLDMYLVRKNMVVTPAGKTVKKFQIDSKFTIRDMRDMYSPSELVADVGISKIKRFGHYQGILKNDFQKLIENVDFAYYPEIGEAAMKYLNATSYGEAALEAVIGYEDARAGTKSMRVMVVGMIRDEPEDGRFMDANPTMKNVYLVHQMIREQEKAVGSYLKLIRTLIESDPAEVNRRAEKDGEYE